MQFVNRRWLRYAAPALLLLLGSYFVQRAGDASKPDLSDASAVPEAATAKASADIWQTLGQSHQFVSGIEHLPASLDGTEVPDGLRVDAQGNLIVTAELRDIFDYFLSSLGEEDLDTLIARVRAYLADNLSRQAAQQANRILEGYLAWRDNLATIVQAGGMSADQIDLNAVRTQQTQVQASCLRFLDAEVCDTFFTAQNLRDNYAIDRLAVLQDDSLTAEQKGDHLAALSASLPAPMQQQFDAASRQQELQRLTQALKQEGGDDAALRTLREQVVGVEAANRLQQLDAQRAQFTKRMDQWLAERGQLMQNSGLSEVDRALQIQRLRNQRFSSDELQRVLTLEHLADSEH